MNDSFRVNFLIAGTQKGGTTALASFLSQHPEICMAPKKELHFFDSESYPKHKDDSAVAAAYRRAFPDYHGEPLVGEATPIYMYVPYIAERIRRYNPAMKIICVLRNPVERAFSHYRMERARGREPLPFGLALLAEPWRLREQWTGAAPGKSMRRFSYIDRGFYSGQIENLRRHFSASQIHVLTTEDLWERHAEALRAIYRFLGVTDQGIIPQQKRVFASDRQTRVSPAMASLLRVIYGREIARIEELLGRPLRAWK